MLCVSMEFDCVSVVFRSDNISLQSALEFKENKGRGWMSWSALTKSIRKLTEIATFIELIWIMISFITEVLKESLSM